MKKLRLSPYHKTFYYEWKLKPDSCVYNLVFDQTFDATLNISRLSTALERLISEYRLFNSHVVENSTDLYWQKNSTISSLTLFSGITKEQIATYVTAPFHLQKNPLYRFALFLEKDKTYRFLLVFHHILLDGNTFDNLIEEISRYYNEREYHCPFTLAEQERQITVQTTAFEKQLENKAHYHYFWKNQLKNCAPVDLRFLLLNQGKKSIHKEELSSEIEFHFGPPIIHALNEIKSVYSVSPYLYSQLIFACLIHHYTSQKDFAISYPVGLLENPTLVQGTCINTVFFPFHFVYGSFFTTILKQAKTFIQDLTKNQPAYHFYPVSLLLEEEKKEILNVFFAQTNFRKKTFNFLGVETLKTNSTFYVDCPANLLIEQELQGEYLYFRVRYFSSIIDKELLFTFTQQYQTLFLTLLQDLYQRAEKPIRDYFSFLVNKDSYYQLIYEWNNNRRPYPKNKTIFALFEERVLETPHQVALVSEHASYTYDTLNQKANQLAYFICQNFCISPDDLIVFCLDRTPVLFVAMLAILKAGAAYVPVSPNTPLQRMRHIIKETKAKMILTQKKYAEDLNSDNLFFVEEIFALSFPEEALRNKSSSTGGHHLAYVMYTSGTTGIPKGVMIEHHNVVSLVKKVNYVKISPGDNFLQLADIAFDAATFEIWGALLNGASLYLVKDVSTLVSNSSDFETYLIKNQITILWLTKSLFDQIYSDNQKTFRGLKYLLVGGEALNYALINKLAKSPFRPQHLINGYGPTENTTFSCVYEVDSQNLEFFSTVPIGRPLVNRTAYVLNEYKQLLPLGAIGELYVGGEGLARGYLNKELSEKSFIENPFQKGRLYKTGDLVRQTKNGLYEFMGRSDSQAKIRGYRIELRGIESKLKEYPGIQHAIVVQVNQFLVGYYSADVLLDQTKIIRYLSQYLSEYEMPKQLIYLKKIPLTPNGKLDKQALPPPTLLNAVYNTPQNVMEKKLCQIFTEALELPENSVGTADDFFHLGGNSIVAIKLTYKINRKFNCNLHFNEILRERTIKNIAKRVQTSEKEFLYKDYLIKEADTAHMYEPFELSNIQQAYYFGRFKHSSLGEVSTHLYNEYLFKHLDLRRLEYALNKVIERHLSLRTIFANGQQQYVERYPHYTIRYYKLSSSSERELVRNNYSHKIYDTSQLWLFDLFLTQLNNEMVLHFSIDPLIMDAASLCIFFNELTEWYHSPDYAPPPLQVNYRSYIKKYTYIRTSLIFGSAKNYWEAQLKYYNFELNLPLKKHPNSNDYLKFNRVSNKLSLEVWNAIKLKANSYGISPTVVVLCAYGYVLSYWSNQKNLCINLTLFDRLPLHEQIDDVIGDFTITQLFNYKDNSRTEKLITLFDQNQETLWHNMKYALFDGIDLQRLVREKIPSLANEKILAPVVLTSMLGMKLPYKKILDDSFSGDLYSITQTSQIWLDNKAYEKDDCFVAEWDYVEGLFEENVIQGMHAHYCEVLNYLSNVDWLNTTWPHLKLPAFDKSIICKANSASQARNYQTLFASYESAITLRGGLQWPAIIDENTHATYSYDQLLKESNGLAQYLLSRGFSVPIGNPSMELIAILSNKGYNQALGTLSIMKTGHGYLPLNTEWPIKRLLEILKQAKVKGILISKQQYEKKQLRQELLNHYEIIIIENFLDHFRSQKSVSFSTISLPLVLPEQVAYVIFTSGSSGIPKGVTIDHKGAFNTIEAVNKHLNVVPKERILALSELSFDLSVYDIFGVLAAGGTIVFPLQEKTKESRYWLNLVHQYQINIWNTVPQLANLLIDEIEKLTNSSISLRLFLLSGDWIPLHLPSKIKKYCPDAQVVSLGGATEGSIWSIWYEILSFHPYWTSIPYGVAMPNQKIYILNRHLQHCPVGVSGDIYIGGDGIALNYYEDPEKTSNSFIFHPELGRLYRTGDVGRWHIDGYVEFIGRQDNQVKIHGYRIELEEISSKISQIREIQDVVTQVVQKDHQPHLVSYYTSDKPLDAVNIQNYLVQFLPIYMIPDAFVYIEKIPLTANGKTDRSALPIPDFTNKGPHADPRSMQEILICQAFSKVLKIDTVGTEDDFFQLGGNSLLTIQLISLLQESFNINVSDIFNLRTPALLAKHIKFDPDFLTAKLEHIKNLFISPAILLENIELKKKLAAYEQNIIKLTEKNITQKKSITNVLLTGATGFLGCNLLNQLLINTTYNVTLLIRASSDEEAWQRVSHRFSFYFDNSIEVIGTDRLSIFKANIEKPSLGLSKKLYRQLTKKIDSVIHCAGLVKHYGEYDAFHKVNVLGTIHLLELSKQTLLKDFHYISTYGALNIFETQIQKESIHTEDDFFDKSSLEKLETLPNVYVKSKLLGEQQVIQYREQGVNGNIHRVGNLAFMLKPNKCQDNVEENAFANWLKYLLTIQCITEPIGLVEITPADLTAQAIVKLFDKEVANRAIFHIFNPYPFHITNALKAHPSLSINILSIEEFIEFVHQYLINPFITEQDSELIMRFLLYQNWLEGTDRGIIDSNHKILQTRTGYILKQLGFEWNNISNASFYQYIDHLSKNIKNNE